MSDCVTGDISYLAESDIEFLAKFGTPEKPVSVDEFLEFWNSLTLEERGWFNDQYWRY